MSANGLKEFKYRVEINGIETAKVHEVEPGALVPSVTVQKYWEDWANLCKDSNKLPETVDYGFELGEGDYITGAVTSKGTLIVAEFDEIDEDTEVSVLYVRRRNGQMDLITHDNVYLNAYPVSYKSKEKK
jgi:hypothetical protein